MPASLRKKPIKTGVHTYLTVISMATLMVLLKVLIIRSMYFDIKPIFNGIKPYNLEHNKKAPNTLYII